MTVWLTRPSLQASKTEARLKALGLEVWSQPVMAISALNNASDQQKNRDQIMNLDVYHFAIFVSQNAVSFGFDLIDDFWPQLPMNTQFLGVGAATAKALSLHGADAQSGIGEAMDSESLLALPELQAVDGLKALLIRGVGGRTKLADTLVERGCAIDHCELYQRMYVHESSSALAESTFGRHCDDIILIYSGESLSNVHQCIADSNKPNLKNTPIIVPGARVASLAKELGFSVIHEAKNASDDEMIATMTHAFAGR